MSRITRMGAVIAAVGAAASLSLTACGTTNSSSSGGACNLKIGYLGALTGDAGALGQNMLGGINTALAKYNAAHSDCKVTVVAEDSQGDAAQATPLAKTLIDNSSVIGVVGPGFSKESAATGAAFAQSGLATVSPSATNVKLTTNGWKTFHRVLANDDAQGPAAAKYLTEQGAKKIFVIDDSEDYGTGLAGAVKNTLGAAVAGTDSIQQKSTDFSATVTKVKGSGADAVFFGGYYQEGGLIVKQLRQAGWKGLFESGDGSEDPAFITVAGKGAAEGSILTAAAAPATAAFTADYKAANSGKAPGLYSAEAYDATNVFLDAISAGKKSRADVLAFINGGYDKPGITKEIKFTDTGEVTTQTIYAYVVKNGVIQPGTPIK